MIDSKFSEFLQHTVNSFVKWDLIRFFHDNPHARDTAESIARYTGRETGEIIHELDQLATDGVLHVEDINDHRVYTLVEDKATRETIHAFMKACENRDFRVEAINQVIRGMQEFSPRRNYSE